MIATLTTGLLAAVEEADRKFVSFSTPTWAWVALVGTIVVLLVADLLLVHRTPHDITLKQAGIESAVWVTLGLSFTFVMLGWQGGTAAGEYLSGYLIEKSLSVDNVFVWAVIFSYFAVPTRYQFKVLFYGIFGALVLRAVFIFAGVALLETFDWILYVFGGFLIITAVRVARHKEAEIHPENNPVLRLVKRVVPSTHEYDGQKLFTRRSGKLLATPLFAVLILVETTDVCSRSTRSRPSSPCRASRSSSSRPTPSRSSGCAPCTSSSPGWTASSGTSTSGSASSSGSSASR